MKKTLIIILLLLTMFVTPTILAFEEENLHFDYIPHDYTIYSTVTLEYQFSPQNVVVILTRRASRDFRQFTTCDFPEARFSYVKCYTPGMELVRAQLEARLSSRCDSYYYDYTWSIDLNYFRRILILTLTEPSKENVLAAISLIQNREDVMLAEPEFYSISENAFENIAIQPLGTNWWQNTIRLNAAHNIIANGQRSVFVGVIDSGINRDHPALSGTVYAGVSRNFDTSGNWWNDTVNHGTPVAGIIAGRQGFGVAHNIRLASLRVSGNPALSNQQVLAAVNFAIANPIIRILNISMTTYRTQAAIIQAIRVFPGLVVGSAGNGARSVDTAPEYAPLRNNRPPNLLVVGASIQNGNNRRSNSNFGRTHVDLFAPGDNMLAPSTSGTGAITFGATSSAAPVVSGVAALMLSANPTLTGIQMANIIRDTVNTNVHQFIRDNSRAGGIVDAYAAVRAVVPFNPGPWNAISAPSFIQNGRTVINQNPFTVNVWMQYDSSGDGDTQTFIVRTLQPGHGFTVWDSYFNVPNHWSGFSIWFQGNGMVSNTLWWS